MSTVDVFEFFDDHEKDEQVYGDGSYGRLSVSENKDWGTPPDFVAALVEMFPAGIDLDPCSNSHSLVPTKVAYVLPEVDGLVSTWKYPTIYVNPPYGRDKARGTTIKDWLAKCAHAHQKYGSEVVALVPVATNTSHWRDYVFPVVSAICFVSEPRFKFCFHGKVDNKGAPMAVAVLYWGTNLVRFQQVFSRFGHIMCGLARLTVTR